MGLRKMISGITVEPCMFFFSLCQGMFVIIAQSLYIAKVCEVNLGYNKTICDNITFHKEEQAFVQKYTSELQAYNGILQAIPSVFFALFAGPWSDTHGRRLLLICSSVGFIINNSVFIINTYWFYELKAEYLLFECLQDCTGGFVIFFLACYSYITDITTKEERTKRLAYLDGMFPAGFFLGMGGSGFIKEKLGYYGNFSIGIFLIVICILYTVIFLKDSRDLRPPEVQKQIDMLEEKKKDESKGLLLSFLDIENVKSGFRTILKKRPNNFRTYILLLATCFLLEIFLITGKGPTMYLFFRRKFSWDNKGFGAYIGLFGILGILAQYGLLPFMSNRLKLHDLTIALIAIIGVVLQQTVICFTPASYPKWILYLAGVPAILSICITTVLRSLITKCVKPWEIGTVFSVIAAVQAMMPIIASPLYGFLYKQTLTSFPGAFLLLNVSLYFVVGLLIIWVYRAMTSNSNGNTMENQIEFGNTEQLLKTSNQSPDLPDGPMRFENVERKVERKFDGETRFENVERKVERKYDEELRFNNVERRVERKY